MNTTCAVSVIIPMYNAEKYLSVCLESVLIQTFKDFEVIVVDDCSTDASPAIAESYLEKFGGRLKIIYLPENTGTPGLPRNVGLEFASGKYIYFVDSDDFIVDNALEMLFEYAETYQAEVVYTDIGFKCGEEIIPDDIQFVEHSSKKFIDKEIGFETENLAERIEEIFNFEFEWVPWLKFSRRDFLINNGITFPAAKTGEDGVWTFKIVCLAKKILLVHEPFYVQRFNKNSITRSNRSLEDWVILHVASMIKNIEVLDEFMMNFDSLKKDPAARLSILDYFISSHIRQMSLVGNKLNTTELYEIFQREFSKAGSNQPALSSYLLVMNNLYRNELLNR